MDMSKLTYLDQVAGGLVKLSGDESGGTTCPPSEDLIIVLDCSYSMGNACGSVTKLDAAKDASISLIEARLQAGASDRVAVISFADSAKQVLPWTSSKSRFAKIRRGIASIVLDGGTDLNTPLKLAKRMLPLWSRRRRTHLVLLTDGQGGDPVKTAIALKKRGVIIETIGVGNSPHSVDEPLLKKIASVVNGNTLYRFIHDRDALVSYFKTDVANRLVKRG